ncbi:MAG: hypothetical protein AAFV53_30060 [Myxococcota bacterium]
MRTEIRTFRRSARIWLSAWRQLRQAFYRYQRLSNDLPGPGRFRRIDRYIRMVEADYAALDDTSMLVQQRAQYHGDITGLARAIQQCASRTDSAEAQALLCIMSDAIERFERCLSLR